MLAMQVPAGKARQGLNPIPKSGELRSPTLTGATGPTCEA